MTDKKLTLTDMKSNQSGRVREIHGGPGLANRLDAMGIRPGKKITKLSSMMMRGPVTVQVDNAQLAIGFGMARKIIVEIDQL